MSARVAELRAKLPKDVRLHYAMKCNPMPDVVAHFDRARRSPDAPERIGHANGYWHGHAGRGAARNPADAARTVEPLAS